MSFSSTTERPSHSFMSPRLNVYGRSVGAYRVVGLAGLAFAAALGMFLASERELSRAIVALILTASVVTFFVVIISRQALTGEERITYYHHEIGVLVVAAILLRTLGEPLLPYLDVTILGLGIFLTCGRVGCFRVGCCYGRPHRWGLRYGPEHEDTGFCPEYVGVRLFPIQLIESSWVLCIVAAGAWMVLTGRPAGSALSFYVVTYAVGRFGFEFMRGDPDRHYLFGFSEAQWISLGLSWVVVAFGVSRGAIGALSWVFASGLSITMVALAVKRAADKAASHRLLHAAHIRELAAAVKLAGSSEEKTTSGTREVYVARTSMGLRISCGDIATESGSLVHFTLSRAEQALTRQMAAKLAPVISEFLNQNFSIEVLEGSPGVFHLLIRDRQKDSSLKPASERQAGELRSKCPYAGPGRREPAHERY